MVQQPIDTAVYQKSFDDNTILAFVFHTLADATSPIKSASFLVSRCTLDKPTPMRHNGIVTYCMIDLQYIPSINKIP